LFSTIQEQTSMTTHHPIRSVRLVLAGTISVIGLVACAKTDTKAGDTAAAAPPPPPPAAAAPAINDAQIAHIVVTANSIDSAAGEVAKRKGTAKAVKDFAQTMVTDHGGVNKQAVALATKLNVTPEDNDTSRQLKLDADAAAANLNGLTGAAFDKAYIDREVTYHQAVLDALDKTLIPNAQNAELKGLLEKTRPAFVAHLDRAKSTQATLAK
jgi:putative membrane protein